MPGDQFDADVLDTAVARKPVLDALSDRPHHRKELQAELDLSKTTCHRIVSTFDDHGLLRRTDDGYALSTLGEHVAAQVATFDESVRAAYYLEPLLEAFADAPVDFPVELFADANVTRPADGDPMQPIDRSCELYFDSDSNTIRTLDRSLFIPSVFIEEVFEAGIEDKLVGEFVFPVSIARERIEETEEFHREMPDLPASVQYRIYEDVPFGMSLYDDYVDLRAYDDETGSPVLLVDTGDPEAVAWAEEVYQYYRERAEPASAVEEIPDWLPEPEVEF